MLRHYVFDDKYFDDKYFYNTEIKHRIRDKFIKETIRVYNFYLDDTKTKFLEAELSKGNIHYNKIQVEGYLTLKEINKDFHINFIIVNNYIKK